MADINDLYPSQKEYEDYFKGQQRRGNARSKAAISPIFTKARDKVTTDILEVLNDRRYLKITDSAKRLKAVKRDPKMKQVEAYIIKAGEARFGNARQKVRCLL